MFDVKIINGTILDGTGKFRYKGDVGIEGDKITAIGDLSAAEAKKTIDAAGKFVAPGFIDFHTHSDLSLVYDKFTRSRIYTGVTMDVVANCGIGVAPIREERKKELIWAPESSVRFLRLWNCTGILCRNISITWTSILPQLT